MHVGVTQRGRLFRTEAKQSSKQTKSMVSSLERGAGGGLKFLMQGLSSGSLFSSNESSCFVPISELIEGPP